jgi:dihydroxy-acid dehydratase
MSVPTRKTPESLRSARWFAPDDLRTFGHRSRLMQLGYADEDYQGKPVIGVLSTWSELNSCHSHFPERVQDVKRGVTQAGGFAVEMPTLSVDESFTKPTSMLYRSSSRPVDRPR